MNQYLNNRYDAAGAKVILDTRNATGREREVWFMYNSRISEAYLPISG